MSGTISAMDTKSKILFWTLGILVILSVSASYYRFMVLHDYLVQTEIDCDPSYESCFVWECDTEEEECTGNPDEDTWYYKIAYRNEKNIPNCSEEDEECDHFTCPEEGEEGCREVLCSPTTLEEYHIETSCTIPDDFADVISDEESITDESLPEVGNEDATNNEGAVTEEDIMDDVVEE